MLRKALAMLVPALLAASPLPAQHLTLADALRRADRDAYDNRAARARDEAAGAQALVPLRGILPTLRVESGYAATTDPVAAFGTTLRQRRLTAADFDPARLNGPPTSRDLSSGVVLEVPLVDVDAIAGRRAALRAHDAARAGTDWTREETRATVVRAYYGAVLAGARVATLETAARAAHDHARQADAMLRNGLVTRSDVLLADVRAGDVDAELAGARADATLARRQLALAVGAPEDTAFALPTALPSADAVRTLAQRVAEDSAPAAERSDVRAARLSLDAARADAQRARTLLLPRVNAFARADWHAPDQLAGERNWTAGVMLTWTPFAGASEIGERRAAAARERGAAAAADGAAAQARLDLQHAGDALRVALVRLDIAERGAAQSAEAHRIVARKYDGGLAGITELLDAAAIDTRSALTLADARYGVISAAAALREAAGRPLDVITTLDSSPEDSIS